MKKFWTLNGTFLSEYRGLSEEKMQMLRYLGSINYVHIFTCATCPNGILELWEGKRKLVAIFGNVNTSSLIKEEEVPRSIFECWNTN